VALRGIVAAFPFHTIAVQVQMSPGQQVLI
jgi:hypothetical protein